ncbi:Trehalose transport system permease protein SugB [Burkholderiales bacterium]|nr:Trehalose transport system permease protein SugB [Burkholderiales bacterium]
MTATVPARPSPAPARGFDTDRLAVWGLAAAVVVPLLLFVALPLFAILRTSFITPEGDIGLANYAREFASPKFSRIVANSFAVSLTTTAITVVMAYLFAYALKRTAMPFKRTCGAIALLPLYAPSLVQALGILFLFGRNGIVNRTFDLDIDIYGFWGIVIADVLYSFPHAFLILSAALAVGDARLYESARMLGAGSARIFRTITLPSTRFGILSAIFVVFTIVITDFGNPMVIGADYTVLATEIYNQVSGQGRMELGAVIGVVLLVPAAIAVIVERMIMRGNQASITDGSQPLSIGRNARRDRVALAYAAVVCLAIASIVAIVFVASFVTLWPYNMHLSFRHYRFEVQNGIAPLWTSVVVSLMAAVVGVVATVSAACVSRWLKPLHAQALYFMSVLPAAVPGMVLGLGYILVFNDPANPLEFLYGTLAILAICNVYHYHAQGYLIASTSVGQVSRVFDETSTCLGAGMLRTLRSVILPIVAPSIASIAVFYFVRSMVTLSAVIFLVTPATQLAAVSVLLLDDSGNQNQAAAFSVCIMLIVAAALGLFHGLAGLRARRRAQRPAG